MAKKTALATMTGALALAIGGLALIQPDPGAVTGGLGVTGRVGGVHSDPGGMTGGSSHPAAASAKAA